MDPLTATSTYAILMQTEGVTRIEGAQGGGDRCGEVASVCVCVWVCVCVCVCVMGVGYFTGPRGS